MQQYHRSILRARKQSFDNSPRETTSHLLFSLLRSFCVKNCLNGDEWCRIPRGPSASGQDIRTPRAQDIRTDWALISALDKISVGVRADTGPREDFRSIVESVIATHESPTVLTVNKFVD